MGTNKLLSLSLASLLSFSPALGASSPPIRTEQLNATWFDLNCRRREVILPNYPFPFSFVTHQSIDLGRFARLNPFEGNSRCLIEYLDKTIADLSVTAISDPFELLTRGRELLVAHGVNGQFEGDSGIIYYQFPVDSNVFFGDMGEVWAYMRRNNQTLKKEISNNPRMINIRIFDSSVKLTELEESSDTARNRKPNYQTGVVYIANGSPFFRFRNQTPNIMKNSAWSADHAFEKKDNLSYWEKLNRTFSYFLGTAEAYAATN